MIRALYLTLSVVLLLSRSVLGYQTLTASNGITTIGGAGGGQFPTVEDPSGVKILRAWMGEAIDTLFVEWFSGAKAVIGPIRGGYSSGYAAEIQLNPGEQIVGSIYGCSDSRWPYVSCIQFTTTNGQVFSACDSGVASCNDLSATQSVFNLTGFFGRSGTALDQLGFLGRVDGDTETTTAVVQTETAGPTPATSDGDGLGSSSSPTTLIAVFASVGIGVMAIVIVLFYYKRVSRVRALELHDNEPKRVEPRAKPIAAVKPSKPKYMEPPSAPVETGEVEFDPTGGAEDIPPPAYDERI